MAKKRALVDAVLTTTAASDIFTQDLEELNASLATMQPATEVRALATLNPSAFPIKVEPSPSPTASAANRERSTADDARVTSETPTLDFRHTEIHFGKNRGLTLAELTPQQIHWYESEWMPKKETEGLGGEGDKTLVASLKAYRVWRDAEKATTMARSTKEK